MSTILSANSGSLSDREVDRFSLAGTPEDCLRKLEVIKSVGIDKVWIRPFSAPGSFHGVDGMIELFGRKVLPRVK